MDREFLEQNGLYECGDNNREIWQTKYLLNDKYGKNVVITVELVFYKKSGIQICRIFGSTPGNKAAFKMVVDEEIVFLTSLFDQFGGLVFERIGEFCNAFGYDNRCLQCISKDGKKHRAFEIPNVSDELEW